MICKDIPIIIFTMLFVFACSESTNEKENNSSLSKSVVEITGEGVVSPGKYEYREGMVLIDLVNLAGGWTKCVSKKRITVQRIINFESTRKRIPLNEHILKGDIIHTGCPYF